MPRKIEVEGQESRPTSETLEEIVRVRVQAMIQQMLEEEVDEYLGRGKSERRGVGERGYRNGHGKPRRLTLANGTIELRRPRIRDLEAHFESQILPLFLRRTKGITALLPQLYLHGLSLGDFDLAMRGLLGQSAPLSASTMLRLKDAWQSEYTSWKQRDLSAVEIVYCWVYVKAGVEDGKAALLVVIGAQANGEKVLLAVESGHANPRKPGRACSAGSGTAGCARLVCWWRMGTWGSGVHRWRSGRTRKSSAAGITR